MSVKVNVLKTLEENRGFFFSGEELANKLYVSRAAIWKAMKELEKEGYQIKAIPNRGYCLTEENDILSVEGIRTYLSKGNQAIPITVDKITQSTNQNAKLCAATGGGHGALFVANQQTAGRGRRGRSFLSMDGNGIYMSLILKPKVAAEDVVLVTTAASVAVYRAIKKITGITTAIKWVNDLYYRNKKVCGILTEAVTDCESGIIDCIILGIGINFTLSSENIPEDLKNIVGALYDQNTGGITRNQLIAEIVNQVLAVCDELPERSFLVDYRENSMVLGKEVNVIGTKEQSKAIALAIENNGGLRVRYIDGREEILCSGEISIRLT